MATTPVLPGGLTAAEWRTSLGVAQVCFSAAQASAQKILSGDYRKVQYGTENFDVGSNYDNVTNYRHTPSVAGKYKYHCQAVLNSVADGTLALAAIKKNNTTYYFGNYARSGSAGALGSVCDVLLDMNGTSDYVEGFFLQTDASADGSGGQPLVADASYNFFSGERIST